MELDGIGTLCCFWSCNFQTNQKLLESPIATYIAKSNESSILWFFIHNVEGRLQILQSHCGKSCGQFPHFDILTLQSGIDWNISGENIEKFSLKREKRKEGLLINVILTPQSNYSALRYKPVLWMTSQLKGRLICKICIWQISRSCPCKLYTVMETGPDLKCSVR